jgi:hypothetical protein
MDIKTKFKVGQEIYCVSTDNWIFSFIIDKIKIEIRESNISILCYNGTLSYHESKLFLDKEDAKNYLIEKIKKI